MGFEVLLGMGLLVGAAALYWVILRFSAGRIGAQYRSLAERFGLELEEPAARAGGFVRPEPAVYGVYRGREVSISAPGKGLQNTRQIESVLKVELKYRQLDAELVPTGLLGGLRRHEGKGQARWRSRDEAFDRAVEVRTNQGVTLTEVLTEERRSWLAERLRSSKGTIRIGGGIIAYAKLGLIADDTTRLHFEGVVEFLCDLAEAIEG